MRSYSNNDNVIMEHFPGFIDRERDSQFAVLFKQPASMFLFDCPHRGLLDTKAAISQAPSAFSKGAKNSSQSIGCIYIAPHAANVDNSAALATD